MSKITGLTKAVTRESAVIERGRALIVTLKPRHLEFRLKGLRRVYSLSLDAAMWLAIKKEFEAERRERAGRRRHA